MFEILFSNLLKQTLGPNARFKEGQYESIVSTINNHFTLVVQKTGWGKSMVYFLATKYFRQNDYGPTIIVSPLLSLMRNQKEAAERLKLKVVNVNGESISNSKKRDLLKYSIINNEPDIIYITPEQLLKEEIRNIIFLRQKEFALFVIDEVHCISEWGHDFRPSFSAIKYFVKESLVKNNFIHILATTATANDDVIQDLRLQFQTDISLIRGDLARESLNIKIIKGMKIEERYAWVLEYVKKSKYSGIIYALTVSGCEMLARFLRMNQISAYPYHSRLEEKQRLEVEARFYNNEIKVLVATSALGMGYDKPDVGFVIHIQCPKSILEYYQQIGRAGRNLSNADAVLMCGSEDRKINEYFINSAMPCSELMQIIANFIDMQDGVTEYEILENINIKKSQLEAVLKHLTCLGYIYSQKNPTKKYYRSFLPLNLELYTEDKEKLKRAREIALMKIEEYCNTKECYMKFISRELNAPILHNCGKCCNCTGLVPPGIQDQNNVVNAKEFINAPYMSCPEFNQILPKTRYPNHKNIEPELLNEVGYFLCKYGIGLGELVIKGKYEQNHFSEILVKNTADMLNFLSNLPDPYKIIKAQEIVYIPSKRHPDLVKDFAKSVAQLMGIPCIDAIYKKNDSCEQKKMENSSKQYGNVIDAFDIKTDSLIPLQGKDVYLIDDMVDSGWTFTVAGMILKAKGKVKSVTPIAIANSSN